MKRQLRILEQMRQMDEPILSLPLVELWGNGRVLIEGHSGVLDYGTETITVQVSYGRVRVTGMELQLCKLCARQLVITGNITSISLIREERR